MASKILVIGAGISGLTLAEQFAKNNKVTLVEQRNHLGGNCYDFTNQAGILIHKYGPHIFHTDFPDVWQYLSRFTKWTNYQHKVLGYFDGQFAPIPFNLNSLKILYPQSQADLLAEKLIKKVGLNQKVPILDFLKAKDQDLKNLAQFVYDKVFLEYTQKQWGLKPSQIDPSVTARVPIYVSRDNSWFQDKYQGMPKEGFARLFEKMVDNKNIEVKLNTNYHKIKNKIKPDLVFYTGALDRFFNFKYGKLDYRFLRILFRTYPKKVFQPAAVVNYPSLKFPFTRITEYKKLTRQIHKKTTVGREYPGQTGFMAYPVNNLKNQKKLKKYQKEINKLKKQKIYFVGRLAQFKYFNMDQAVKNSLDIYKQTTK